MKPTLKLWYLATAALLTGTGAEAPAQSCHDVSLQSPQLREQEVHVSLRLGFSRTEIVQTVYNPNPGEVEAILHFPLPESAAVSEIEIGRGETGLFGEVLPESDASDLFQSMSSGESPAGLARRIENGDLEIRIDSLAAESETPVRFVYYAPHLLQGGKGTYAYPAQSQVELSGRKIWTPRTELQGTFSLTVDLRYSTPIEQIVAPGFKGPLEIIQIAEDHTRIRMEAEPGEIEDSAVLNYFMPQPVKGAVDLTAHRPIIQAPGIFMMVLTPPLNPSMQSSEGRISILHFPGGNISETTELDVEELHDGKSKIIYGRYSDAGRTRMILNEGQGFPAIRFDTLVSFPAKDDEFPELERLWAQERSRTLESMAERELYSSDAASTDATLLGRRYQILAGSNAMILLPDSSFKSLGLSRPNDARVRAERLSQSVRDGLPVWKTQVDLADAFFVPDGRKEGACCFAEANIESRASYGVNLSSGPEVTRMVSQRVRYW